MVEKVEIKERQHYVFQSYLKRWVDEGNELWVCQNGKIKHKGTKAVAYEPFFYRIRSLNKDEYNFFTILIGADKLPPETWKQIKTHIELYQMPLVGKKQLETIEKIMLKDVGVIENLPEELREDLKRLKEYITAQEINQEESFYSDIEDHLTRCIEKIMIKDFSFYKNETERLEFLQDVCIQYFRTKSLRDRWARTVCELFEGLGSNNNHGINPQNIDIYNVIPYYFWILQNDCVYHMEKKSANMVIYENKTNHPFITCDQPVINIDADYCSNEMPEKLRLYYPLSPHLAIIINDNVLDNVVNIESEDEIIKFNVFIAKAADKYIFSNSETIIRKYVTYVK